jgi:hypothetical protein
MLAIPIAIVASNAFRIFITPPIQKRVLPKQQNVLTSQKSTRLNVFHGRQQIATQKMGSAYLK